jgi:DNA-binding response OmpR family regulator
MVSRQVPILVLGNAISLETKLLYFELGIDDFLVGPVAPAEFLARVRASLRRLSESRPDALVVGELRLDRLSHRIFWREHEIHLTNKEFLLLEYLMTHAEKVVTREELVDKIWHTSLQQSGNTVDVFVRQLRRKIDDRYQQKLIHTVRGHGYMVRESGGVLQAAAADG